MNLTRGLTNGSVGFKEMLIALPAPWKGLFQALVSKRYPDKKADVWYQESADSGFGHQPAWGPLLRSLTLLEPYIIEDTEQLGFKPKLLHLPPDVQISFLQFLRRHGNRIPDCEIKAFVCKLVSCLEPNTPALAHLNRLGNCMKSEQDDILSQVTQEQVSVEAVAEHEVSETVQTAEKGETEETSEVNKHDHVIYIDDSDDDIEPKAKRQRVETSYLPTDLDITGDESGKEQMNAEEVATTRINEELTSDTKDTSDSSKQVVVDNTSIKDQPMALSEHGDDREIKLSQEKEQAIQRLKEIWNNTTAAESCPTQELESLVALTTDEMSVAAQKLELTEMSESSVLVACGHLVTISDLISYSNTVCFLKFALCEKVMTLTQNASRVLSSAVTMVANKYPKQLIDSALVPCVRLAFDSPQLDLVTRIVKESFNEGSHLYFLRSLVDSKLEINDSKLILIQALTEIASINDEIIGQLFSLFEQQASSLAKNLKFGKLLLAIVNKHGKTLSRENLTKFSSIVDKHQTFLKKSIENAIKKLS